MRKNSKRLSAILLAGWLTTSAGCAALTLPPRPQLEIVRMDDGGICLPPSSALELALWLWELGGFAQK